MPRLRADRSEKIDFRCHPSLKKRVKAAAKARKVTVTHWLETIIEEALARELGKTGRTDSIEVP